MRRTRRTGRRVLVPANGIVRLQSLRRRRASGVVLLPGRYRRSVPRIVALGPLAGTLGSGRRRARVDWRRTRVRTFGCLARFPVFAWYHVRLVASARGCGGGHGMVWRRWLLMSAGMGTGTPNGLRSWPRLAAMMLGGMVLTPSFRRSAWSIT